MARIPVVRIGEVLIATVQEELHDSDALELQEELSQRLELTGAHERVFDARGYKLGRLAGRIARLVRR